MDYIGGVDARSRKPRGRHNPGTMSDQAQVGPDGAHGSGRSPARAASRRYPLLWMAASGLIYGLLNASLRYLSLHTHPFQALTLVYASAWATGMPLLALDRASSWRARAPRPLLLRGAVHWLGMSLWIVAVGKITLAETTVIGFTTPIFILIGAAWLLHERAGSDRYVAAAVGFAGVLVVVGPSALHLRGAYSGLMLASAVLFAASFLLSKRLTRVERVPVIVLWQSAVVTLLSLPLAAWFWRPLPAREWLVSLLCGLLANAGNYCLTRAFQAGEISASQPAKFLDLVWACAFGWMLFGEVPTATTLAGGVIILGATIWITWRA